MHAATCGRGHGSLTLPPTTGGRLPAVLMRPTPQLSVKTRGGGGRGAFWGGSRLEGVGGGVRPRGGGGFPRWGGLRATHYYHMHTSWGDVCLGVWGYGGRYAAIALSRPCREESLKGCRVAPCRIQGPGRAAPPCHQQTPSAPPAHYSKGIGAVYFIAKHARDDGGSGQSARPISHAWLSNATEGLVISHS